MTPATFALGGATVVGSMSPTRLKESPIRTAVLSGASLNAVHAQDLVESLDFSTGVRETVGCGVCGTNSVQLNGMEGVYSLVLIGAIGSFFTRTMAGRVLLKAPSRMHFSRYTAPMCVRPAAPLDSGFSFARGSMLLAPLHTCTCYYQ